MTLISPLQSDSSPAALSAASAAPGLDGSEPIKLTQRQIAIGLGQVIFLGSLVAVIGSWWVHQGLGHSLRHTQGFAFGVLGATIGAVKALLAVALVIRVTGSLLSAPMVGMAVRIAITGLVAMAAVQLLDAPMKVTAVGALVGYLLLMVLEVIWLYRLSDTKTTPAQPPTASAGQPAV